MPVKCLVIIFIFIALSISAGFAAESSLDKINTDYKSGQITQGQKLIYQIMSVIDSASLPSDYKPAENEIIKSATHIFWEAASASEMISDDENNSLKEYRNRPNLVLSQISPEGYFRIHYNLEGPHAIDSADVDPANGIPDYVDWVGEALDSSYHSMHLSMGYIIPPSDGILGGDSLYDCYLINVPAYGYTVAESIGPEDWDDYITYIAINHKFDGFPENDDPDGDQRGAIRATCAHEYFHAIHYAYTLPTEFWYMEISSTWMEEICYPQVNDNYNYIDSCFNYPHYSLNSEELWHHYGTFVWNRFLDQHYDTLLIKSIWEDLRYSLNTYNVINDNLVAYGSSLYEAYSEFALWNWCTNIFSDDNHYDDGSEYPQVNVSANITFYPVNAGVPPGSKKPDGLSSNYIKFNNPLSTIGDLYITFDGQDAIHFKANIILARPGNDYTFTEIELDTDGAGSLLIPGFDLYDYVVLNPVVKTWYADSVHYDYTANLLPWPDYAAEVAAAGPLEIYSNGSRTVQFKVYNRGASAGLFEMTIDDELGWEISLPFSFHYVQVRDSALVSVDVISPPGTGAGVINNIYLTATSTSDSSAHDTGTLPTVVVSRNGDANNDGTINVSDAVYIINYVFVGGQPPFPDLEAGNANCDESVNVSDAVFIINYVFTGGPGPPCLIY